MEAISKTLQGMNFENSQNQSRTTTGTSEISLYRDSLTKKVLVEQIERVKNAFPKLSKDYLEILKDRFAANGFTDERMKDSINHVIDTYEGWDKLPNIANFIKFNKTKKLKTYEDIMSETADFSPEARRAFFESHKTIKQNGKTFWVEK
jgi:hypothetical protein